MEWADADPADLRRAMNWLAVWGVVALLVAWPLWHVTRTDASSCIGQMHPCDPRGTAVTQRKGTGRVPAPGR